MHCHHALAVLTGLFGTGLLYALYSAVLDLAYSTRNVRRILTRRDARGRFAR